MENSLAMTSANSLRTLPCTPPGPIEFCTIRFLKWSWTCSSLTVGSTLLPNLLPASTHLRGVEKQRQKYCWVHHPVPYPFFCSLPFFFIGRGAGERGNRCLFYPSSSVWHTCPSCYFCASFAKFSVRCTLAFFSAPLHNWTVSLYPPQDTMLPLPVHLLLPFNLTSRSILSQAELLPSLPDFLCWGRWRAWEEKIKTQEASDKICRKVTRTWVLGRQKERIERKGRNK